jgi:hypothetical protein
MINSKEPGFTGFVVGLLIEVGVIRDVVVKVKDDCALHNAN